MLTGWDSDKKVRIRPGKQLIPTALSDITLPVHLNSSSGLNGKDMAAMFSDLDPVDPHWSSVVLAMPMDGANGSTTFTDLKGKTVTRYGNAQISTAQSKFGGASGYFDGSGDYLQIGSTSDFFLSDGDFTVEGFVYLNDYNAYPHIIQFNGASITYRWALFAPSRTSLALYTENGTGTGGVRIAANTGVSANNQIHFAVVKNGSTTKLFVDGVEKGSTTTTVWPTGNLSLTLGTQYFSPIAGDYLNGYIDDLRITKGVARYTANFAPPTRSIATTTPTYSGLNPLAKKIALEVGDTGVEVPISILTQDWDNVDNTAEAAKIYAVFEDLEDGNDFTLYWDSAHADNANVTEISSAPEAPAGGDALTVWSLASSDDLWLIATEFYTISGTVTVSAVAAARRVVVFDEVRIYQSFFSDSSDGSYGCFVPSTGPFNIAMIGNAGEYSKIFSGVTAE